VTHPPASKPIPAVAARAARRPRRASRHTIALLALLAPYGLGTLALVAAPAALSFLIAFAEYDALSPPTWRGLGNFAAVLRDPLFAVAARNSLLFVLLAVPLRLLGALGLALLLRRGRKGAGLYRAAVFMPTEVPDVAYALIWTWILNPIYGPLNQVLRALGLPAPAWLAQEETALLGLVIMALFQVGEGFVMLLAGLQDIPEEFYLAAAVDGAGRWQQFSFITLPLLAPWLLLLTLRDTILTAQSTFAPAYLMTGGGPYYATLFLPLLIYQEAFDRFRFGYGAAMLLLLLVGVALLLLLVYYALGRWGYGDD
jgi:multiple sugar transport system permease protein